MSNLSLKTRSMTPPGGFYFKDPNGEDHRHIAFDGMVEEILMWYRVNHKPAPENLEKIIDSQCAEFLWSQGHRHCVSFDVPSIFKQHHNIIRIDDNKLLPDCPHNYNPGLIHFDGSLWLVYRRHENSGTSKVVAVQLDDNNQPILSTNKIIDLPVFSPAQTDEDPRVWWFNKSIWLSWVSWRRDSGWDYLPTMRVARLDEDWNVVESFTPKYGNNGSSTQKNWSFFEHDGKMKMVYHNNPFEVVEFDENFNETQIMHSTEDSLHWKYGEIRGGTPFIRVGDEYLTFMHSRIGTLKNNTYYMGAYYLDAKTLLPTRMTKEPLLAGSDKDPLWAQQVLVVFPEGLVVQGEDILVSIGVNDKFCAIYKTTISEINNKMTGIK